MSSSQDMRAEEVGFIETKVQSIAKYCNNSKLVFIAKFLSLKSAMFQWWTEMLYNIKCGTVNFLIILVHYSNQQQYQPSGEGGAR